MNQQVGTGQHPRQPQRGREQEPLRRAHLLVGAPVVRLHQAQAHEHEPEKQQRQHLARHLQPLQPAGVAGQDAEETQRDPGIPEHPAENQVTTIDQDGLAAMTENPSRDGQAELHQEAKLQRQLRGGLDAAISQPSAVGHHAGGVHLDAGQQRKEAIHQQPGDGTKGQKQHRTTAGAIHRLARVHRCLVLFGFATHLFAKGLHVGHQGQDFLVVHQTRVKCHWNQGALCDLGQGLAYRLDEILLI